MQYCAITEVSVRQNIVITHNPNLVVNTDEFYAAARLNLPLLGGGHAPR